MHRSLGEVLHVYVWRTACEQIHKQAKIDLGQYPAIFGLLPGQYLHVQCTCRQWEKIQVMPIININLINYFILLIATWLFQLKLLLQQYFHWLSLFYSICKVGNLNLNGHVIFLWIKKIITSDKWDIPWYDIHGGNTVANTINTTNAWSMFLSIGGINRAVTKGQGQGFSPATSSLSPGYFDTKWKYWKKKNASNYKSMN